MFKDFDAMLREKSGGRPEFTVGGQHFTCRSKLPFKKLQKLMATLDNVSVNSTDDGVMAAEEFFKIVLLPQDRDRFMTLLHDEGEEDDDAVISFTQVFELLNWLSDYYLDRKKDDSEIPDTAITTVVELPDNVTPIKASLNPVS